MCWGRCALRKCCIQMRGKDFCGGRGGWRGGESLHQIWKERGSTGRLRTWRQKQESSATKYVLNKKIPYPQGRFGENVLVCVGVWFGPYSFVCREDPFVNVCSTQWPGSPVCSTYSEVDFWKLKSRWYEFSNKGRDCGSFACILFPEPSTGFGM